MRDEVTVTDEMVAAGVAALQDKGGTLWKHFEGHFNVSVLVRTIAQAALAKRDGEFLALKKALTSVQSAMEEMNPLAGGVYDWSIRFIEDTLTSTTQAAQAAEERIRDDERAKCLPTNAALDVLNERQRQKSVEGWSEAHDDQHDLGELSDAAASYASMHPFRDGMSIPPPKFWPWGAKSWKPSTYRRDLIKAGALILAEIERLDRASLSTKGEG